MSLSGRLALFSVIFVLCVEALVLLPWLALYRMNLVRDHLSDAALVAEALRNASDDADYLLLANKLYADTGLLSVSLQYTDRHVQLLAPTNPAQLNSLTVDSRSLGVGDYVQGGLSCLSSDSGEVIRIVGGDVAAPYSVSALMFERPICRKVWSFAGNFFAVSLLISLVIGLGFYIAARRFLVKPILRMTNAITSFRAEKDSANLIEPRLNWIHEFDEAEISLRAMQERIIGALDQREKLATVGESVAKIQHDLRNMLGTAQLVVENLGESADPKVQKNAPRLERAIARAINLSQQTLEFGRLGTRNPKLEEFNVTILVQDTIEAETALARDFPIEWKFASPPDHHVFSDEEFVQRIFSNLVRNARQILMESGSGQISINIFSDNYGTHLRVRDTGPGMSEKAKLYLFQPFKGSTRKGGTGLGLALAHELAKSMGAKLSLVNSDPKGTVFDLFLPERPEISLAKPDTNR